MLADRKVAVVGNHLPRQCGIATFTSDLSDALQARDLGVNCFVVAVNDAERRYIYRDRVCFEISQDDLASYHRAADFLNVNCVNVLCLQHEYGIYGGTAGAHVLALLRDLQMPVVTTLHTILAKPTAAQRLVMTELAQLSERLVVMSQHGAGLLRTVYQIPSDKVDFIPHGIDPVLRNAGRVSHPAANGQAAILTFGLLSPDKGIEYVINALPAILAHFPRIVYTVLGATHPVIREHYGESYRQMLERRVQQLGVENHVRFYNRFVSRNELREFLAAADIYVTPYLNLEQITSGTLAYALGSGKTVISTPYLYAEELLADGRGILVPCRDSTAIADHVIELLGNETARRTMQRRALAYTGDMAWPHVARQYVQSYLRAIEEYKQHQVVDIDSYLPGGARPEFEPAPLIRQPEQYPEAAQ